MTSPFPSWPTGPAPVSYPPYRHRTPLMQRRLWRLPVWAWLVLAGLAPIWLPIVVTVAVAVAPVAIAGGTAALFTVPALSRRRRGGRGRRVSTPRSRRLAANRGRYRR